MKPKTLIQIFMIAITVALNPYAACAEEADTAKASEDKLQNIDLNKVSESFGYLIHKNIDALGLDFDINLVIQGIQNSLAGKEPPLQENDCIQAIALIQENAFQKQAQLNLQLAEDFMAKNRLKDNVIELEEGKVQYKIEQIGHGEPVEADFTPTVRFTGEFADGTVFASSNEDEIIPLQDTLPGLRSAIIGMKEGEKRIAFIHPELAYGDSGYMPHMPPNSLLKFNIELIKANTVLKNDEENTVDQTLEELANHESETAVR